VLPESSNPSVASASISVVSSQQSTLGGGGGKPTVAPENRKSKKGTLTQIDNRTISAAKALSPVKALSQRNRKKKARPHSSHTNRPTISAPCSLILWYLLLVQLVSYAQLARSIHELAAMCDQVRAAICCIQLYVRSFDLLPSAALVPFILQKRSQRQLVNSVIPKLDVYNSVDIPRMLYLF
jgi:hypothetical protein